MIGGRKKAEGDQHPIVSWQQKQQPPEFAGWLVVGGWRHAFAFALCSFFAVGCWDAGWLAQMTDRWP